MAKISKKQAQQAVRTILEYIGEDPDREGLVDTPRRVINFYETFAGTPANSVEEILQSKFHEVGNFDNFVLLRNIEFSSLCEHHMLPVRGHADIAYIPDKSLVGISKLARVVEFYARRLQLQERMTLQIANALTQNLCTKGVAVRISASHSCMTIRGVFKNGATMNTAHYTGKFLEDKQIKQEFLDMIK